MRSRQLLFFTLALAVGVLGTTPVVLADWSDWQWDEPNWDTPQWWWQPSPLASHFHPTGWPDTNTCHGTQVMSQPRHIIDSYYRAPTRYYPMPSMQPLSTYLPPTPQQTTVPTAVAVNISNFMYQPQQLLIAPGTTVTFVNNDSTAHTVTSDMGLFDSGMLAPGQSFQFTFSQPGTYAYHCSIHPTMLGSIAVP